MKWISVNTPPLKVGDTREIRRFLFRPKTLNGETRWLEWSTWKQEAVMLPVVGEGGSLQVGWVDVKWMGPYNSIQHFLADHPWPRPPRPKPASASV